MAGRTKKTEQKGPAFESEAALIEYLAETVRRIGLTQQEIADKSGIDRPQVNRILKGEKTPTIATFFKLANVLGIRIRIDTQGIDLIEMGFYPQGWKYPNTDIEAYFSEEPIILE